MLLEVLIRESLHVGALIAHHFKRKKLETAILCSWFAPAGRVVISNYSCTRDLESLFWREQVGKCERPSSLARES